MKRFLTPLALVFLLLLAAPARAAGPTTNAAAFGIELCPQSICGSAIFTGILSGTVAGTKTRLGSFVVAVQHTELQLGEGQPTFVTGGVFQLRAGLRTVQGVITGGQLIATGENTFIVDMQLMSFSGQTFEFQGLLNHNTFPPTISGQIFSTN